jgi:hypothetical protein
VPWSIADALPDISNTTSAPVRFVASSTAWTGSSTFGSTSRSAPIFEASARRSSFGSMAMTFHAPAARAMATENNPIGPHPITATGLVARSSPPAVPKVACTAFPNGSMMEAASGSIPSPTIHAFWAGITTYPAKAPSVSTPRMRRFSQMWARPVRHVEQCPQAIWVSAATKAPGWTWCTSGPTAATWPASSCPKVMGVRIRAAAHSFQS